MANVSRLFQDRMSPESMGEVKQPAVLDAAPNCLSINKDCTQVVVAGRSVFKIFGIEEDQFVEKVNLRSVQKPNLSYCTADLAWNYGEDHILASASTNGSVIIWNLNINTKSKQERILAAHRRTATRVNFHKHEHHLLISGSMDGSMKLFDLRKKEMIGSFEGKSDAVRDVQFNPHQYFQFAAAFDNGNVQVWDFRYPSRKEYQFTAHFGPCFSLTWHPDDPNWMGTAGRDRIIKVWDMQNGRPKTLHQIQTIAPVSQIKWRPQRKHHIASCAIILDYNVNIWDVRRPYIPFAAFEDHKDVVTGIVWRHGDPHMFYTSSKDCTLQQHTFRSAARPADKANPVSVDISIHGAVGLSTNDKLVNSTSKGSLPRIPPFFRRAPDRTEQFTKVTSICNEFGFVEELSTDWLLFSAQNYKLTGKSVSEICDHNANVAQHIGRHEVAQTWRMIKLFCGSTMPLATITSLNTQKQDNRDADTEKAKSDKQTTSQDAKGQGESDQKDKHIGDISTGVSEEESDPAEAVDSDHLRPVSLTNIASGLGSTSHSDFFFGDGALDTVDFDYDNLDTIVNGQESDLPIEAIQPRLDIDDWPKSPDPVGHHQGGATLDSPSSANDSEFGPSNTKIATENHGSIKQEILSCPPFQNSAPTCNFSQIICDMLHRYAEQGDVQMCVTVLIVLRDKIQPQIDQLVQEQWIMSYIDLLGHFQLWCEAAEIIKLCNHGAVSQMNQQSTMIDTNCSSCSKPLHRGGWLCDRCKGYINTCSICHLPVRGLYAWCQGCSHGGHLKHIQEWLKISRQCPAGCGHMCEYSM